MNTEWMIQQAELFRDLVDRCNTIARADSSYYFMNPNYLAATEELEGQLWVVLRIAEALGDGAIVSELNGETTVNAFGKDYLVAPAAQLVAAVNRREEVATALGPSGPSLAAAELHPWVWEEAAPRWDAGFYRDAVQAAATRIFDVELPKKLGVQPSKDPAGLFAAFAPDKTSGTVLRFPDLDPTDASWASVHRGTMLVGQGCVMAIRNPRTHRLAVSEDQVTLEELATLSLLARWIDDAEAVPASAK